jgi:hypothetical protein
MGPSLRAGSGVPVRCRRGAPDASSQEDNCITPHPPRQAENHNIWWYAWVEGHKMMGSAWVSVYYMWTLCGGSVERCLCRKVEAQASRRFNYLSPR